MDYTGSGRTARGEPQTRGQPIGLAAAGRVGRLSFSSATQTIQEELRLCDYMVEAIEVEKAGLRVQTKKHPDK